MCIYPNCKVRPNYNNEGETKGIYCTEHKLEGMINVISKTCIYQNCKVRPNYNNEGETKGIYCAEHKLEGMIDVKNKTCIYPNCKVQPTYNNEGETKGIYCAEHKLEGMINVKNKTCIYPNCKVQPVYNNEGETKGIYCTEHKLEGMIDVKHKTCIYPNCKVRSYYNNEGETKGIYCAEHKLEGMIDVISKTCKSEWCYTTVTKKYQGYCLYCYIHLFPDKKVSRNYKTKETAVVEFIKDKFSDYHWLVDKRIIDGCSKRRPDLFLDLGYQIIIVEVDEGGHPESNPNYETTCENKRIMEISQDVGHRPIIFIRFNPDGYKKNGKKITSCWNLNKNGICVVKKSKINEWNERLSCLENTISYCINPENFTNKTVEIIKLFYDE